MSSMSIPSNVKAQQQIDKSFKWKKIAELPDPPGGQKQVGLAGVYAGLTENLLLIAGGANFPVAMPWQEGKKKYWDDIYIIRKTGNGFIWQAPGTQKLKNKIAYGASVTTTEGVVMIGGETEKGLSSEVVLLKWNKVKKEINSTILPSLPDPLANAGATVVGNSIYLAGGETPFSVSNQFYSLDMNHPLAGWKRLPEIPKAISHMVLVAQSAGDQIDIYLMGGRCKKENGISELYSNTYEYSISKNAWTEKASMPYALSAGTGMAVGTAEILLFGGDKGETFHQVEVLVAAINNEKSTENKQKLINKKNNILETHPGFSKELLSYHTVKDEWTSKGIIPYDTPVTTTLIKWGNHGILPSGEIKAGVRTPVVLSVKIIDQ